MSFSGRPPWWQALHKTGLLVTVAGAALLAGQVQARDVTVPTGDSVPVAALPVQARDTYRLILSGGPFPGRKDGVVFLNRERVLPQQSRGYYHEYTVPTPGAHDRGARRIVCGGNPPTNPEACYYTADHYNTFQRIIP